MTPDDALTQDHFWWRPGWRPGRAYLTWHVLVDDPTSFAPWSAAVDGWPEHATVAPHGLHLTVQGVGFVDEVRRDDVARLLAGVRARLQDRVPFDLALPIARVGSTGTGVSAAGHDPARHRTRGLRHLVRSGLREAGHAPPGGDDDPFAPHVTLTYATGATVRSPLEAHLAAVASPAPVLRVDRVTLLALRMEPPHYAWEVVDHASLTGGVGPEGRRR